MNAASDVSSVVYYFFHLNEELVYLNDSINFFSICKMSRRGASVLNA